MLTVLDLFSGIGGISLGLERTGGFKTVMFCEIEPFPRLVLKKRWPEVPIHEDVRTLSAATLGGLRPDCIVGGFPCQPFSVAGSRKAQEDDRHLWPEFARLIRELEPRWIVGENVPGIRTAGVASGRSGADEVLEDLEALGYSCWPVVVGADDVEPPAPHRRKRAWFVAYRHSAGSGSKRGRLLLDGERSASRHDADGRGERPVGSEPRDAGQLDDATESGREAGHGTALEPRPGLVGIGGPPRWPARPGEPQHEWEEPRLAHPSAGGIVSGGRGGSSVCGGGIHAAEGEGGTEQEQVRRYVRYDPYDSNCSEWIEGSPQQPLGSPTDGLPSRLVRLARRANREALKAYGNSVVSQVVTAIGFAILEAEKEFNR